MTAFTPPPESWLNRYPKSNNNQQSSSIINSNNKKTLKVPEANQLDDTCKRYIETSEIPVKSNKSLGTDDHFKSAVCSKNLLKACEKLIATKKDIVSSSETNSSALDDEFDADISLMNEKSRMEYYRSKYGNRRNSQSLPASPKLNRKEMPLSHNPYFTISKPSETRPDSSISFLTSLFGITAKNPTESSLVQKYEATTKNTANSNTNNIITMSGGSEGPQQKQQPSSRQMTPQPHIYREMNIFSPTSM